ncbi:hypothetical protein GXP67_15325 [Rhodocytophaga rosea]|uniref:DoxX family protein n=1 Tax=Rhodocytophaga rosea TaxID=2704465 RepID=A0A6C0GIN0_9BACT|nr:hypothetical protein [Rhodocytophaga rosea]QHT67911.1 hypothetical protein GXP67_15325 [Rhodocytophaga rosea]
MLTRSNIHSSKNYESTSMAPHYLNLFVQPSKPEPNESTTKSLSAYLKMKVVYTILQIMVSLVFILGGILLWIADIPVYLFSFQSGIPVSFLYGMSIIATLLALIQLFPVTSFAAQLGLTLMSIAVFSVHLILGSPLYLLLPALLLLILTLSTICLNYKLASPDTTSYQAFE